MKTCKLSWAISAVLLLVVIIMAYKFILSGSVAPSSDNRQTILLDGAERDLVLGEMRMFLGSIQQITDGLVKNDMQQVIEAARRVGAAAQQAVPGSLMGKLPLEFKQLGFDTHKKFDLLALDAESMGEPQQALQQLAELTNNCVACHASYRIDIQAAAK